MTEQAWKFDVGTTTERPIVIDQYVSRVTVLAQTYGEAMDLAAGICMRPGVEMVTSTTLVM